MQVSQWVLFLPSSSYGGVEAMDGMHVHDYQMAI